MKKELLAGVISASMLLSVSPAAALTMHETERETAYTQEIPANTSDDKEMAVDEANELIEADPLEEPTGEQDENTARAWYNTSDAEFTISTAEQLFALAEIVNDGTDNFEGKTITLDSNIDLKSEEWTPIGGTNTGRQFAGIFDGNGHTISNLKITRDRDANKGVNNCVGLFGACTNAAKLQNFTLHNVDVTGCLQVAAVLGGSGGAEAQVTDVHVSGSVQVRGWWYVGGIMGKGYSTITDCSVVGESSKTSYVSITGGYAGGIVGFMGEGNCKTIGCTVENLTVEGAHNGIGGINGILHFGNTIENCTAENVVVWQTTDPQEDGRIYAGAFAGTYLDNNGQTPPTVNGCEFTGEIYSGQSKRDILEVNRYVGSLWYGAEPPATVNITDCTIHIPPAAQIGDTKYDDLVQAITAAQAGDTVKILRHVTIAQPLTIDRDITVTGFSNLSVEDGGALTISAGKYDADPSDYLQAGYAARQENEYYIVSNKYFTITFHANGGEEVAAAETNSQGQLTVLPVPVRDGYTFDGWFTAAEGGETVTVDTIYTADTTIYAHWTRISSGGGASHPSAGGSSSTSGSSGNKTETTENSDGSTTTTTTGSDGTVTETTKYEDGSKEVVKTDKDGNTTTTHTDANGNKIETVENADGTIQTIVDNKDGSTSTTTVGEDGKAEANVSLSEETITNAAQNNAAAKLPMPEVAAASDRAKAPTVTVKLASDSAKVEIPVEDVTPGTVAVLVKADGTEEIIKTSLTTENGVVVTLGNGDTVKILDNSKNFVDVSKDYWGSEGIAFATSRELFNGTSETTFSPEQNMSRAMIWTVLARLDGADTTRTDGAWYQAGMDWAIASGISDGSNPNGTMTREQLVTMLYRYSGSPAVSGELTGYTDLSNVNDYAANAMSWAIETGLVSGMGDGTLAPQGTANRAQVATILKRFCEHIAG